MPIKNILFITILSAGLAGFSIWSNVDSIDDERIISNLHEKGIYVPQSEEAPLVVSERLQKTKKTTTKDSSASQTSIEGEI